MPKNHTSQSFLSAGAWDIDTNAPSPVPQWNFMIAGDWGSVVLRVSPVIVTWFRYPRGDGSPPDWDAIEQWLMASEKRTRQSFGTKLKKLPQEVFEHLQANWTTA